MLTHITRKLEYPEDYFKEIIKKKKIINIGDGHTLELVLVVTREKKHAITPHATPRMCRLLLVTSGADTLPGP